MKRPLTGSEKRAWLRLARTERIGPISFHRLLSRYGEAERALEEARRRTPGLAPPSDAELDREWDRLDALGAVLLASCEPDYPRLLAQLAAPPPVIAARGNLALAERRAVGVVGAREASGAGLAMARNLAQGLGELGFVVVSGLARGVDAAAHAASLPTGSIAVLAGGLGKPYPPQNIALHDALAERGLVVSEAPCNAMARARDFPRRNHIISGLSEGVVVIEAALRSGSLITARAAGEQGREVMAVPGSPLDPRARGSNALIKSGAALVEDAHDVAAALGAPVLRQPLALPFEDERPAAAAPGDLAARLGALLSPTPVHVNDLARHLAVPIGLAAAALAELELEGRAETLAGGYAVSPAASRRVRD